MNEPKVALARMFEKVSGAGRRYFVGRLGASRLLLFANDRGELGEWQLFVQAIPPEQPADGAPTGGDTAQRSTRRPPPRREASAPTGDDAGRPFHSDPLDDIGRGP